MNTSIIIKLFLHFLIHLGQASSMNYTLFKSDSDSDFLEIFFTEFEKAYLRKHDLNNIEIIDTGDHDLRQVNPLLQGFISYTVCTDTGRCDSQEEFGRGSFLIVFLGDSNEGTFGLKNETLSRCKGCKVLFVADGNITIDEVLVIFTLATEQYVQYIEFALQEDDEIKLYSNYIATTCSMRVRLVTVWKPGDNLDNINSWAFHPKDFNRCPVSVSSLTFLPKIIIEESKDGSLTIAGGQEGRLLLAIAKRLNFTIALQRPSVLDRMQYSRKMSIINDVINGIVEIGVGRIRPTKELEELVAFSVAYDEECVTWGVPRIINWPLNIAWVEFSWKVWAYIGSVFCVICAIESIHQNMSLTKNGNTTSRGFIATVLDMFAVHLGNPIIHVSFFRGGRIMLVVSIMYALIVTTAYKSSLAAILATNEGTSLYVDLEGMLIANLTVGGSAYDYNILKDQVNDSDSNLKLLEKFVVNNNDSQTLHRLIFDHDYAVLARLSSLNYHRLNMTTARKFLPFDILNDCVLTYPVVMTFGKKSFLRRPANIIIQRLIEAGILEYWDNEDAIVNKIVERQSYGVDSDDRASKNVRTIFILYSGCVAVCLVTFTLELLASRLDSIRRRFDSRM